MGCKGSKYDAAAGAKEPDSGATADRNAAQANGATAAKATDADQNAGSKNLKSMQSHHSEKSIRSMGSTCSMSSRGSHSTIVLNKIRSSTSRDGNIANSRIIRHMAIDEVYHLDKVVLGTGINGAVRSVVHKVSGHKAALKSLSTENMSTKRWELLYNEVDLYLKLDHPNICKLLEVYEDEKAVHLIMELCTGKELYERLANKKRYSERDCIHAVFQMLQALHYMHWHKMVHRDLKLENWVYSDEKTEEESKLKLIDFGFSKHFVEGSVMTAMHGTLYYVAPEVLEGRYDQKCDIWSIGVIVYMLLSGSPPFNGQRDEEISSKIKRGRFSFENQRWANISEDSKDFIRFLLRRDPDERPSAQDALGHAWLKLENDEHHTEISLDVLSNIQHFSTMNTMKRAACGLIAFSLSTKDMKDLERQFEMLDKEKNGTILIHELTSALVEHLKMSESEAQAIFNRLDQTGDQEIHYSEFMAASLQARLLAREEILRDAFDKFDVDRSGSITVDNLRDVLGDVYNGTRVEDIIAEVDIKQNGVIDYEEFVKAVLDTGAAEPASPIFDKGAVENQEIASPTIFSV